MSWERKWKEFQTADRLDEARKKKKGKKGTMSAEEKKALKARSAQKWAAEAWNRENAAGFGENWAKELTDRGINPEAEFEAGGETIKVKDAKPEIQAFLLSSGAFPPSPAWVSKNPDWTTKYGFSAAVPGSVVTAGDYMTTNTAGEQISINIKATAPAEQDAAPAAPDGTEKPAKPTTRTTLTGEQLGLPSQYSTKIYSKEKGNYFRQDKAGGEKTKMSMVQKRSIETALAKNKELSFDAGSSPIAFDVDDTDTVTVTPKDTKPPVVEPVDKDTAIAAGDAKLSRRERRKIKKRKEGTLFQKFMGIDPKETRKAKKEKDKRKIQMWDIYKATNPEAAAEIENPPPTTSTTIEDPSTEETLQESGFEKKWKNYQRIVESTSKGHLADNEFQDKMKSLRSRNNIYTKPSGARNTSKSSPFSTKAKSFGKSNTYFENMNEAEQEVLDSFELQSELNPAAFDGDVMIAEIRERLMEIAQDFLDGVDFKMDVEDITLTGSLANYNWSKYSDFDLHILVDYAAIDADQDLVKRFFQDLKAVWNIRHNIFLKGYEVEVYVQNTNESHMSSGVYSVQNDDWVLKPEREETARSPVDKPNIEKKADDISFQIDRAERLFADGKLNDALDAIDRLKQKVRNLRKIGLSKEDGVYSVENLAFKTLRRSMELERLSTLKNKVYDKSMSITQ